MIPTLLLAALLAVDASTIENADLARAIAKYDGLDFRGALPDLRRALRSERLGRGEMIEALAYLGRIHAILDNQAVARVRFRQVLRLEPDYALSADETPRVRVVFDRVKVDFKAHPDAGPLREPELLDEPAEVAAEVPAGPASPTAVPGTTRLLVAGGAAAAVVATVVVVIVTARRRPDEPSMGSWQLP
ncbi:MAG: hypothetical protein HY903_20545 [Deltaproteobacteria bacterium]|nr:hypothetical protein [Deltaproteobacteria bacterium]